MKAPAFQFYAADFLVGTAAMTNEEVGIYARLLCHQWDRGSVTKHKAARLVGAKKIPADVLAKFVETDGELRNERLEAERRKQNDYREQQSQRGKAGADARWKPARDGTGHATANGETMAPPSSGQCPNDSSPPPSSVFSLQSSNPSSSSSSSEGWGQVVAELSGLGMADVSGTITLAKAKQYRPEDVLALIAHYRAIPGRWRSPGAISWRIEHSPPSRAVDEGWPPAAESPKKPPVDIERLESTYGIRVGHMSAAELNAAMQRAQIPVTDPNVAACRESRSPIRAQLLAQLARDAASSRAPPVEPTTKHERTPHITEASAL